VKSDFHAATDGGFQIHQAAIMTINLRVTLEEHSKKRCMHSSFFYTILTHNTIIAFLQVLITSPEDISCIEPVRENQTSKELYL
jgi:hypothetical protein